MYTIRLLLGTTLGLTMSGVKMQTSWPAKAPDVQAYDFSGTNAYVELKKLKNMDDMKKYVKADPKKAQALLDAADARYDKIAGSDNKGKQTLQSLKNQLAIAIGMTSNESTSQAVARAVATSPAPAPAVAETITEQAEDILAAVNKLVVGTERVKDATKADIATERTEQGNEAQATALLRILETKHQWIEKTIPEDMKTYLKDVNMASLSRLLSAGNSALVWLRSEFWDDGSLNRKAQLMLNDIGYTADGSLGARESRGLYNFLKFYTSQIPEVQSTLDMLGKYYQNGLDATVALRQAKSKDTIEEGKETIYIVSRLTDTYEGSRIARPELAKQLNVYLKSRQNIATLASFLWDGTSPATANSIATYLQKNPIATAKFYDAIQTWVLFAQTYNKSGNFDVFSLDKILKGKYASLESKDSNESAETKIDEKIKKAISEARLTAASLDKKSAEEFLQKLDALESNPTALGEAKKELIRLAHVGAMANFGRNANMLGGGASLATAVDGLTLNIGLSTKWLGLAARYGSEGKISETTDSTWKGGAWISGGFPAFIALDGSVSRTDKIKIFGGGAFHEVKTDQFVAVISKGSGALLYSRLDNREDNIREYGRRIESALSRVAFDTTQVSTKEKIQSALTVEWLESKNATQLGLFVQKIDTLFKNEPNPASRLLLLRNLGEHQTRMLLADEVSNTVDGKSFGGWSIGIGHMLGVTFPMAGLTWYDVEQSYADVVVKKTTKGVPAAAAKAPAATPSSNPTPTPIELQIAKDSALAELLPQGTDMKKVAEFILASRGQTGFNEFQSLLAWKKEGTADNESMAFLELSKYLTAVMEGKIKWMEKYKDTAKAVKQALGENIGSDVSVLSSINELTSGSDYSRKLGSHIGKETLKAQLESKWFSSFLTANKKIASDAWKASYFDTLYTKEAFANAKVESAPDTNFLGSVDYAQNRGKATGMDQMTSGFKMIGKTEVKDPTEKSALTANLYAEFVRDRPDAHTALKTQVQAQLTKIGSTRTDTDKVIVELLQGKMVEGINGQKITVTKPAQVFKALSFIENAPCFNSAAYITLPEVSITITTPTGPQTTPPESLDVPPASSTRADGYTTQRYTVGVSLYSEKPEPETPPPPPTVEPVPEPQPGRKPDPKPPKPTPPSNETIPEAPVTPPPTPAPDLPVNPTPKD